MLDGEGLEKLPAFLYPVREAKEAQPLLLPRDPTRGESEPRRDEIEIPPGFELLERAAKGLPPFDPVGDDEIGAVQNAATDYSEACLSFCDRAEKCHSDALEVGDPSVLGDDVERFLGSVDLHRAMDLLDGSELVGEAEEDLMRRIAETDWLASR